ncbi:MAG: sigma-54-dependent Fis family transcriptional regulator [Rhodospirillales bacterium]|jgi:two-component system, NtrC family, C4-dicarboxylate transport response regulator DctD|nr:sigma-54-dependent Fis family transcriptional regulator [Rhodospirillales bacterium]
MQDNPPVIVVDDEEHVRKSLAQTLQLAGFNSDIKENAESALDNLSRSFPGVLITDVRLGGMDGMDLLSKVQELDKDIPVILITGHGDVAMAVKAMHEGAFDFLEKPFDTDRLIDVVLRASQTRWLVMENRRLKEKLNARSGVNSVLLGVSPPMNILRDQITTMAQTDADILIMGETGSGKELVARCLHDFGPRKDAHFVAINCGALPETIIESELFGHVAGAFTGAQKVRVGKFQHANGGTVFLDEIESMPLDLQVGLLRVLQERTVEPLGANKSIPLDIRVIAATKVDLLEACNAGAFREDLYYRLNVMTVNIPPLRNRKEDISGLFQHFADIAATRQRRTCPALSAEVAHALMQNDWRGNVRELSNAAERFVLDQPPLPGMETGAVNESSVKFADGESLHERVGSFEKSLIEAELRNSAGNVTEVCKNLNVPRKTLYDKFTKYGLKRENYTE